MPATNYVSFVTQILARDSRRTKSSTITQTVLRDCINLASSFLVTDTTTDPQEGISTWFLGLDHLVDLVVILHNRNELELETVDCASRACSECWTAAGNWRGLDECRVKLRTIGGKLKKILDPNEKTYKGTSCILLFRMHFPMTSTVDRWPGLCTMTVMRRSYILISSL